MTQHIIPISDTYSHEETTTCHCYPKVIEENGNMIIVHNSFDGREKKEVITLAEIIIQSKFFTYDPSFTGQDTVCCYLNKEDKGGWNGYVIKFRYLHEVGYFFDINPIRSSSNLIAETFNNAKNATSDKNEAMGWLGLCPCCKEKLWSAFNWSFHDANNCQNKNSVSESTES